MGSIHIQNFPHDGTGAGTVVYEVIGATAVSRLDLPSTGRNIEVHNETSETIEVHISQPDGTSTVSTIEPGSTFLELDPNASPAALTTVPYQSSEAADKPIESDAVGNALAGLAIAAGYLGGRVIITGAAGVTLLGIAGHFTGEAALLITETILDGAKKEPSDPGNTYIGEADDPGFQAGEPTYIGEVDDPGFQAGEPTYIGEVDDPGFQTGGPTYIGEVGDPNFQGGDGTYVGEADTPSFVSDGAVYIGEVDDPGFVNGGEQQSTPDNSNANNANTGDGSTTGDGNDP
ncbi:hypothetical protein ACVXZ4_08370 [Lacisediminihabitans sp. FW035]